ncbi:PRC-barrel domain-containing protein [Sporomusa malonica]|uniref:Uncharacterized protein YrrD, contains PRC-barrel domain n=1 Tax=Sporomusa malonica TaxID=112901 RepID=A0A1W2ANY0_9FIRM|nr:PRC-barrel domain-containing protein [Sporomusa malonica]SMC62417.1 Uncharacterized protein YrrD, contains PRC-barrel domain [Sporomusa malonica]
MKKSVEIVGQPIISITEGVEFGNVKELLINAANGTIEALVIDDAKWYYGAKFLPFEAITALGEHAVTINNSGDILTMKDRPEFEKLLEAGIKVIGTKVLTKGGRFQGKINEFIIDNTGKINVCEMENAEGEVLHLPAERIVTFGKEVLIISEEGEIIAETIEIPPVQSEQVEILPDVDVTTHQVEEPAAVAPVVEIETKENEQQPPVDDSAKKFDDKHRKFLLGKKAARRIETDNGMLIVEQGGEITEEVLQKAKLAGKFVELSMNIQ